MKKTILLLLAALALTGCSTAQINTVKSDLGSIATNVLGTAEAGAKIVTTAASATASGAGAVASAIGTSVSTGVAGTISQGAATVSNAAKTVASISNALGDGFAAAVSAVTPAPTPLTISGNPSPLPANSPTP